MFGAKWHGSTESFPFGDHDQMMAMPCDAGIEASLQVEMNDDAYRFWAVAECWGLRSEESTLRFRSQASIARGVSGFRGGKLNVRETFNGLNGVLKCSL